MTPVILCAMIQLGDEKKQLNIEAWLAGCKYNKEIWGSPQVKCQYVHRQCGSVGLFSKQAK